MKILIYGSRGWIGSQFKEILENQNINYIEGKSRVDNEIELLEEIVKINPTHIISFIGRTHGKILDKEYSTIDYLEEKGKIFENVRDNLFSPLILADICKKQDIHFTYLGTGCIFTFDETHPYEQEVNGFTEDSKPNFFGSGYSTVKGFTDRLMKIYADSALTLRIRMPITGEKNPRNFITKITNYKNIFSIKNSMTVLPELLPFIVKLMQDKTIGMKVDPYKKIGENLLKKRADLMKKNEKFSQDICNILKEAAEDKMETASQEDIEPEESIYSGGFISSKDEALFPKFHNGDWKLFTYDSNEFASEKKNNSNDYKTAKELYAELVNDFKIL